MRFLYQIIEQVEELRQKKETFFKPFHFWSINVKCIDSMILGQTAKLALKTAFSRNAWRSSSSWELPHCESWSCLSLWDRSITVRTMWVNVCAQRPTRVIFITAEGLSDLRCCIYSLLSAATAHAACKQSLTKAAILCSSKHKIMESRWAVEEICDNQGEKVLTKHTNIRYKWVTPLKTLAVFYYLHYYQWCSSYLAFHKPTGGASLWAWLSASIRISRTILLMYFP